MICTPLSPEEAVLNLCINLNSSLLNCCGDTFLTTEMPNYSQEKFYHSFACIDRKDFSALFSLLKHDLCSVVPLRQGWKVCPKYVSFHNLQLHMYIMFLDLRFKDFLIINSIPLTIGLFSTLTCGHCLHLGILHFCPLRVVSFFVKCCLFYTNILPMELCFFTANVICMLPITRMIQVV